ncbi:hypothetical protein CWI37_0536p0020 [Hamiltosporidium tvaerminnensis]|uniref:Uncharacterized protein n=1 Tax=Hamiltosporidium tvaerminnensis TaxID=1176355 RepID=A0A4Q9L4M4_9MICR|nr:hypothetical protein CWI37_0536p0020 [Hamiltosporidium tvaerminnensis]
MLFFLPFSLFIFNGSILLFIILGLCITVLNANRLCKNLQKEFIEFENSEIGAQVLKTCNGSDQVSFGFAILKNSKKIVFPLGACFKNHEAVQKEIRILNEKFYQVLSEEEENEVSNLSGTNLIFLPWFFELDSLKEFCEKYKPNLFQRIGLFFLNNKNILFFLLKYIESLDQAFQKKAEIFGISEQCVLEKTMKIKIKWIKTSFLCLESLFQDISGTDIDFRNDRKLENNPHVFFKEILKLAGEYFIDGVFSSIFLRLNLFSRYTVKSHPKINNIISKLKDKFEEDFIRIQVEYKQSRNLEYICDADKLILDFLIKILWECSRHKKRFSRNVLIIRRIIWKDLSSCVTQDDLGRSKSKLDIRRRKLIEDYKDIAEYKKNREMVVSFLRKKLLNEFLESEIENKRILKFLVEIYGLFVSGESGAVNTIDFIEEFAFKLILRNWKILRSVISKLKRSLL